MAAPAADAPVATGRGGGCRRPRPAPCDPKHADVKANLRDGLHITPDWAVHACGRPQHMTPGLVREPARSRIRVVERMHA